MILGDYIVSIHWWKFFFTSHGAERMPDATAPLGDLARGSCDLGGFFGGSPDLRMVFLLVFVDFCCLTIYLFVDDWRSRANLLDVWLVDCWWCKTISCSSDNPRWDSFPEKPTSVKESFCIAALLTRWRAYWFIYWTYIEWIWKLCYSCPWWRGRKSNLFTRFHCLRYRWQSYLGSWVRVCIVFKFVCVRENESQLIHTFAVGFISTTSQLCALLLAECSHVDSWKSLDYIHTYVRTYVHTYIIIYIICICYVYI